MFRTTLVLAIVLAALALPATIRAQEDPPAVPTPGPGETVLVGRVPVAADTTVTLKAIDLDAPELAVCDTATSFSGPDDAASTSSFVLIFRADCFQNAEAAFICWDPGPVFRECDVVAASASAIEGYNLRDIHDSLVSFSELGKVFDTGLLERGPEPDSSDLVLPEADRGPEVVAELPDTGAGRLRQEGRWAWAVWAGAALVAAGLTFTGAGLLAARRRP